MKKLFPFSLLLVCNFLFVSCDQEEINPVAPEAEASMDRTISFYTDDADQKASYTLGSQEMHLVMENDELEVMFAPSSPPAKDGLVFKIKREDFADGYVGKYSVKSVPDTELGLAETTYYYYMGTGAGSALFSSGNIMEGEFEITAYDPESRLASGKFEVLMEDAIDPTRYSTNLADVRKCDISVTGAFRNLELQVK